MPRLVKRNSFCRAAVVWLAAVAISVLAAGPARAENAQAPPAAAGAVQAPTPPAAPIAPTAAAPRPPQPSAPDKPGFFHEMGRWWDGSIGYLHDKIKATPGTFEDIGKKSGDAAKDAAVATQEGMKKDLRREQGRRGRDRAAAEHPRGGRARALRHSGKRRARLRRRGNGRLPQQGFQRRPAARLCAPGRRAPTQALLSGKRPAKARMSARNGRPPRRLSVGRLSVICLPVIIQQ